MENRTLPCWLWTNMKPLPHSNLSYFPVSPFVLPEGLYMLPVDVCLTLVLTFCMWKHSVMPAEPCPSPKEILAQPLLQLEGERVWFYGRKNLEFLNLQAHNPQLSVTNQDYNRWCNRFQIMIIGRKTLIFLLTNNQFFIPNEDIEISVPAWGTKPKQTYF